MFEAIKTILASKKALATILSVLAYVAGRFGLELNAEELLPAILPLWLYVLGQGLADVGKEREKIASATVKELEGKKVSLPQ